MDALSALFEEQVHHGPNQVALNFEKQTLSYHELNNQSNQIAHYLRELGVTNNTLVTLCLPPCFDLLASIIGVLKAGGAYVPLDLNNPLERQQYILANTQSKLVITHSSEIARFKNSNVQMICLDKLSKKLRQYPIDNPTIINQPDDLAYVIYTSGSTGKPKGVMITHANVLNFVHWFGKALEITHKDIFDFSSSISFDFAVSNTLCPLLMGASIAICDPDTKREPYLYRDHLQQKHVSILKITPSHFRQFKETVLEEQHQTLALRYIVFGGETLFAKDIKDWIDQFPEQTMFCEYGPSEGTIATSWIKLNKSNIKQFKNKIPIGKPATNTRLYILDEQMQLIPTGDVGELYIGGKGVAKGYFNLPELTAQRFVKDPFSKNDNAKLYKTGDYCRYLEDGNIEFVERKDHQVKIRGYRIEMEEIENCLLSHPDIKAATVIAQQVNPDQTEKQLIAYYVLKNGQTINSAELRNHLQQHLPEYMIPTFFEVLAELPLSASGKLNRKKLPVPQLFAHQQEVIPQSKLEAELKQIWEKELGLKYIKTDDNFFYLGGHSLSAARIISKIKKSLKKEIQLSDIYNAPTIGELAQKIKQKNPTVEKSPEQTQPRITNGAAIPLSELQFLFWLMKRYYPQTSISNIFNRQRFVGKLNINKLNIALIRVCKKHPILSYSVHSRVPIQYHQHLYLPHVIELDLRHLSPEQQEEVLLRSHQYLQYRTWKEGDYLLEARVFRLSEQSCELQMSLSHLISDEVSADIVMSELSEQYLNHHKLINNKILPEKVQYKDYIYENNLASKTNLPKDIQFWESYFNGTPVSALSFPKNEVLAYDHHTVYMDMTDQLIQHLQDFCTKNHFSITENLCAAVSLSLLPYMQGDNKTVLINLVKSVRDNEIYDESIGLFLRTDLLKIDLNHQRDFLAVAQRVQTSISDTADFQACPIIVKLACLLKHRWKNRKISQFFSTLFAKIYALLFRRSQLDSRVLKMMLMVNLAKKNSDFFVDVNITHHFIANGHTNKKLFNLDSQAVIPHQFDKTVGKNILNIWFTRNVVNQPNLVLSGNLQPDLLEKIGKDILGTLENENHLTKKKIVTRVES